MRSGPKTIMSSLTLLVVGLGLRASVHGPVSSVALAPTGVVGADSRRAATPGASTSSAAHRSAAAAQKTTAPRATPAARAATRAVPTAPKKTAAPTVKRTRKPAPPPAPQTYTVNGAAADTQYGPVQVQIKVRGGRIVGADAIDYPQGSGRDQEINSYAIPQLDQETLDAQSANIDTVSGATYTSDGYRQSLQSAIDAAHQAGVL